MKPMIAALALLFTVTLASAQDSTEPTCTTRSEIITSLEKSSVDNKFKIAFHSWTDEASDTQRLFAIASNKAAVWVFDVKGCVISGQWVPSTDASALKYAGKTKAELLGE